MPLFTRPAPFPLGAPSTFYQVGAFVVTSAAVALSVSGQVTYMPFEVGPYATAYDRIAANITVIPVAGTAPALRLGIYADDGSGGKPGALLLDAGTILLTATGIAAATISRTLAPGRYWLGALYTFTAAPTTALSVHAVSSSLNIGSATFFTNLNHGFLMTGQAAGAMPASAAAAVVQVSGIVNLALRVA